MKKNTAVCLSALLLALSLCGCSQQQPPSAPAPEADGLRVHFIDVGQADSTLLQCNGQTMLIDGGNVEDSALVSDYLAAQGVEHLDYVVCTHIHEDHVGGLPGVMDDYSVGQVLTSPGASDSWLLEEFADAAYAQGLTLTVPPIDSTVTLGMAQVSVLGPRAQYEQGNDTSLVLRVDYGGTSFLFPGDMETTAEYDLLAAECDLDADVLKMGHHGSSTSSSYVFLRQVMPQYAVISAGVNNEYGHPHREVMSRLRDARVTIYRTDEQGSVVAHSDGQTVQFTTEKDVAPEVGRAEVGVTYIGNKNSRVFHREGCDGLPTAKNQVIFSVRAEAEAAGYTPCGGCRP